MALSSITPAGGGKVSMMINKSIPPCNSVTLHTWHLVTATLSQLWRLYSLEWAKVARVLMCFGSTEHYPYSTTYLDIFCDDRFGSAVLETVGRGRRTGLWIASLGDGEWWAVPTMHCPDRMLQGGIIWLLLWFGIFENPEKTIIKYVPCPWGFGLSGTLDNIPPCVLESAGCLIASILQWYPLLLELAAAKHQMTEDRSSLRRLAH